MHAIKVSIWHKNTKFKGLSLLFTVMLWASFGLQAHAETTIATLIISSVQANNVTASSARIEWSTNTISDSKVYYTTSTSATYAISSTNCDTATMVTHHCIILSGLIPAQTYQFYAVSVNPNNLIAYSTNNSFTTLTSGPSGPSAPTPTDTSAPSAPTSLVATSNTSYIYLSWQASTDNVGVTGYKIYRNQLLYGTSVNLAFADIAATTGQSYIYYAKAFDAAGNLSDNSNAVTASLGAGSSPSQNITPPIITGAHAEQITSTTAQIKWTTNELSSSRIDYGTTATTLATHTATDCSDAAMTLNHCLSIANLTAATVNFYQVTSVDASNNASSFAVQSFTTAAGEPQQPTAPTAPIAPSGTITSLEGTNGVKITWNDNSSDETQFKVYRHTPGTSNITTAGTVNANIKEYKDLGLASGIYEYNVLACNNLGCSAPSAGSTISIGSTTLPTLVKTLTGTIKFSDNSIITDAKVRAYNQNTSQWFDTTASIAGIYTLTLPGGSYQIGIQPVNAATASWQGQAAGTVSFNTDNSVENKTLNITIPATNYSIHVLVTDSNNSPLANVAVTADLAACSGSGGPGLQYKYSDNAGSVTFSLPTGNYCIRAFLPPERGFINPGARSVSTSNSSVVQMKFITATQTLRQTLNGTVVNQSGSLVSNAFVAAASDSGNYLSTHTNGSGDFSLILAANQTWHIHSTLELSGQAYKSSETIVNTANAPAPIQLIIVSIAPLSPPASVNQSASSTIDISTSDGARVSVPPNATGSSGNIVLNITPTVELPPPPEKTITGGVGYSITVTSGGSPITQLQSGYEAEIYLPYQDSSFTNLGLQPSQGTPSYFDETSGAWLPISNYFLDTVNKRYVVRVNHFTKFAIVSPADSVPPIAPSGLGATTDSQNKITLTWTNPTSDFHHARVYRSTTTNDKGSIISQSVTTGSYQDTSVASDTTYYYQVSAVDSAGNESTLSNQVSIALGEKQSQSNAGLHPVGTNISINGTIYMISLQGTRRPYTSAGAFLSYGFNSFSTVVTASEADIALPEGSFIPPQDGKLICSDRGKDKGTCYVITESKKSGFTARNVFDWFGFSFKNTTKGDVSWMDSTYNLNEQSVLHPSGVLVNNNGTIQMMSDKGLLGFPSRDVFNSWGYSLSQVVKINKADKTKTQIGIVKARSAGELSPSI